jgi:hypothetical protein
VDELLMDNFGWYWCHFVYYLSFHELDQLWVYQDKWMNKLMFRSSASIYRWLAWLRFWSGNWGLLIKCRLTAKTVVLLFCLTICLFNDALVLHSWPNILLQCLFLLFPTIDQLPSKFCFGVRHLLLLNKTVTSFAIPFLLVGTVADCN